MTDLRRHAVEALSTVFRARELPVSDRARDPAVAVVERVDRDKPQVSKRSFENSIRFVGPIICPGEERKHLPIKQRSGWRLIVHLLFPHRTRNNLHGPMGIVAPGTGDDLAHTAAASREQGRMPPEQPIGA